jgi:hypothetical protein
MIRPPSRPSPVSKLSLFLSLPVCRRSSLLTGDGGKEWGGEEPNLDTTESLVLYRSLILYGVWCIPRHFRMQICESTYFARKHLSEHGAHYQAWRQLYEIMNAYAETIFH